jgi:peptidoglycan-associated lipoprotein
MRTWTKVMSVLVVIGLLFVLPGCCMMKKKAPEPTPVAPPVAVQEPQAVTPVAEETLLEKFQKQGALLPIYFDFDKYNLKPDSVKKLDRSAEVLAQNPAVTVRIEGNCDERGTNEYNLALGERRANSAKKYLMKMGVAENRLSTISYGEEKPLGAGHDEAAWSQNRRDDFTPAQ